ncbi:MAG: HAD family phosphatase [Bacteroidota bacterium]
MINTVLFDMDGVICHTNPYHSRAFQTFFKKRNIHPTEKEFGEHMYGKSNSYIFSHFFGRKIEGEELLAYEEEKEGLFREIYAEYVSPIEGFLPFLNSLADRNIKLGVATSAPRANMDLILDSLNIRSYFGSLMASEDVTAHKPDPQVYQNSAKKLNAVPDDCLVFEDSFSGVSAAINAQMKVVGVLSSHTKAELPPCDHYINTYTKELSMHIFNR